jgi:hypothetical protein
MQTNNYFFQEVELNQRREELLAMAKRERLARQALHGRPSIAGRLLAWLRGLERKPTRKVQPTRLPRRSHAYEQSGYII